MKLRNLPPVGLGRELSDLVGRAFRVARQLSNRRRLALAAATLLIVVQGSMTGIAPLVLGRLVDDMMANRLAGFTDATGPLLLLGVMYLIREVVLVGRRVLVEDTATRVERDTITKLVSHLLRVDLSALLEERAGALYGRIYRSVEGFVRLLKLAFLDFLPATVTALIALAVACSRNLPLGLTMAAVVPTGAYLVLRQLRSQKGIRVELLREKEIMDGTVVEQFGGIEFIRAANMVGEEVQRVGDVAERLRVKEVRHHAGMALWDGAKALNDGLLHLAVVGVAVFLAVRGSITVGDILVASVLYTNITLPLRELHRVVDEGHESSLRVADLEALLSIPPDASFSVVGDQRGALKRESPLIEATHLSHVYRGRATLPGRRALEDVSFSIWTGEMIGVAGPSGSGKSTWIKVLLRLAHPSAGSLRIAGVPIGSISRETIGELTGYVGQNPFIFKGTVRENIAYGCGSVTAAAVERAARLACIHDEILALPGGYESTIAERGLNLSGGQRQRIAIARIFLKDPPIWIFDEATSAIDNIKEHQIHEAIKKHRRDRTVILVAHRLSTLRDTDRIIVFDHGRLAEQGTYRALTDGDGLFGRLSRVATNPEPERSLEPVSL